MQDNKASPWWTPKAGVHGEDRSHEGNTVRESYDALEGPVVVGIEATGSMQLFLERLEELGMECRVGHPAKIRAAETRKQKHDRSASAVIIVAHSSADSIK